MADEWLELLQEGGDLLNRWIAYQFGSLSGDC